MNSQFELKTERLLLQKFTTDDTDFIIELLNTEGWIKHIGNRNIGSTKDAKNYLLNGPLKNYNEKGFGHYIVREIETLTPIGMCGIIKRNYLEYPDLGFAFLTLYSGKGYAYEASLAVMSFCKNSLHIDQLSAISIEKNIQSLKLLYKLGFAFEKKELNKESGEELLVFTKEL